MTKQDRMLEKKVRSRCRRGGKELNRQEETTKKQEGKQERNYRKCREKRRNEEIRTREKK